MKFAFTAPIHSFKELFWSHLVGTYAGYNYARQVYVAALYLFRETAIEKPFPILWQLSAFLRSLIIFRDRLSDRSRLIFPFPKYNRLSCIREAFFSFMNEKMAGIFFSNLAFLLGPARHLDGISRQSVFKSEVIKKSFNDSAVMIRSNTFVCIKLITIIQLPQKNWINY